MKNLDVLKAYRNWCAYKGFPQNDTTLTEFKRLCGLEPNDMFFTRQIFSTNVSKFIELASNPYFHALLKAYDLKHNVYP